MRLVADPIQRGQPALGALFGAVLFAGAGVAAIWLRLGLPVPVCLFHEWTGLPCPSCGTTRMIGSLFAGDPVGAAAWNPLAFLGLAAVAVWSVLSFGRWALRLPPLRLAFAPWERRALRALAVGVFAAGWAWLVWHGV
jgi:hypothetical protein